MTGSTETSSVAALIGRCDVPADLNTMMQLAKALSRAEATPDYLRGKPDDVLGAMFQARALDVPLWVAMHQAYSPGRGKIGTRAKFAQAMARRAGHDVKPYPPGCSDTQAAVQIWLRGETEPHTVVFELMEAQRLGLTRNLNWQSQPGTMMHWRAVTRAVEWYCPEVLLGMHDTGEDEAPGMPAAAAVTLTGLGPEMDKVLEEVGNASKVSQITALWDGNQSMLDLPASTEDPALTLRTVLTRRAKALGKATDEAAGGQGGSDLAGFDNPTQDTGKGLEDEEGLLECGCPADVVIDTGQHQDGCQAVRS